MRPKERGDGMYQMPERYMNACVTSCTSTQRCGTRRRVCAACISGDQGEGGCQGKTASAGGRGHEGRKEGPGRTTAIGRQPWPAEGTIGVGRRDQGERRDQLDVPSRRRIVKQRGMWYCGIGKKWRSLPRRSIVEVQAVRLMREGLRN